MEAVRWSPSLRFALPAAVASGGFEVDRKGQPIAPLPKLPTSDRDADGGPPPAATPALKSASRGHGACVVSAGTMHYDAWLRAWKAQHLNEAPPVNAAPRAMTAEFYGREAASAPAGDESDAESVETGVDIDAAAQRTMADRMRMAMDGGGSEQRKSERSRAGRT
ncbi:hypothetical protein EON62_06355, partial [archaeon]